MTIWIWLPIAALIALLFFGRRRLRFRFPSLTAPKVPYNRPAVRPTTIYVMHSISDPRLIKVGWTRRRTTARRSELNRKVDQGMSIRFRITLPHAYHAEQLAHKILRSRGWLQRNPYIGSEWYRIPSEDHLEDVVRIVTKSAYKARQTALKRGSWSSSSRIDIWEAGVNRIQILKDYHSARITAPQAAQALRAENIADLPITSSHSKYERIST